MTTREKVKMVRCLATLFKQDGPTSWPGLPPTLRQQPTRIGANLFFLGCAVDGGKVQLSERAWRSAQRFLLGVVPFSCRETLWDWIANNHTQKQWDRMKGRYRLHPYLFWHSRVYRLAKGLVTSFEGDPRRIWKRPPGDVTTLDYTKSALHVLRFGSTMSLMLIGALRDHELIRQGDSPLKPDLQVRRIMWKLGLSSSDDQSDVLRAARNLFGKDSWSVDLALWRLGKLRINTASAIERYYRARCVEKRDAKYPDLWRKHTDAYRDIVEAAADDIQRSLGAAQWTVRVDRSEVGGTDVGFSLARKRGHLTSEFSNEKMDVWYGFSFDAPTGDVTLGSDFWFTLDSRASRSLTFRDHLQASRHYPDFHDREGDWEEYYSSLKGYKIVGSPLKAKRTGTVLRRHVTRAVEWLEAIRA